MERCTGRRHGGIRDTKRFTQITEVAAGAWLGISLRAYFTGYGALTEPRWKAYNC